MKKIKLLVFLLSFSLVASGQLLVANSVSAAEVEVYPGGYTIGDNATEDGHTDNHMIGQSFVPQNINKVTKVKLTNFKLGDASGNKGGIVSVALFQGEPTASTVNIGGRGTTQISPTGAMLAKVGKIFIGGELANDLASFCGVDQNTIEALFLRRLVIANPDRPCPKQSEWTRAYQMLSDNQQGLRDEWSDWGVPYGTSVVFGDSTFDWTPAPQDYNMYQAAQYYKGDNPSKYTGPSWTTQTVSWRGTDNAANYLEVTLPTHSLVPGQPYFLSIQQSYFNQGDYYEEGKYNCAGPNEGGIVTLQGTNINGNTVQLSGETCNKGHVFVVGLSDSNPYPQGRAYFNTYYYFVPANRPYSLDVANLKIWGKVPSLVTPVCISPTNGSTNNNPNNMTFTWGPVPGVSVYDFRLWNYDSAWNWLKESIVVNDLTSTSYNGTGGKVYVNDFGSPINLKPGQNYRYRVSARNSWEIGPWSDCNFTTVSETLKITNTLIDITNNSNVQAGFQGTPSTSGRQAADGGANWYNYLTIKETVTATKPANEIDVVMVAFVPQPVQVGPSPSTKLGYVLQQANNGFVVAYAQCGTDKINCGGFNFTAGHYYVYYYGAWRDMGNPEDPFNPGIKNLCVDKYNNISNSLCKPTSGKFQVTGKPDTKPGTTESNRVNTLDNSLNVKWDVYTWPSFGSRELQTYAYGRIGNVDAFDVAERGIQLIPPPTATLTANPSSITRGQSTTLAWSSTNATKCVLNPPGVWITVEPSGTNTFSPTETTTYNLRCEGLSLPFATTSTTVTVTQ